MKKVGIVAIAGIFLLLGCVGNNTAKTFTMSMDEVLQDMKYSVNGSDVYMNFKTLDPGDVLIIKDKIYNMSYNPERNATVIVFESNETSGYLFFSGDLTSELHNGENVKVKLHIIGNVEFTQNYYGYVYNYHMEYYKESWDAKNHTLKYLPSDTITAY